MKIRVMADADAVAGAGAALIAGAARAAVAARGTFIFAASGGRTPWEMLRRLAREDLPWGQVTLLQVDERVTDADSPDRNAAQLREALLTSPSPSAASFHAMPVDDEDLDAAAARYAATVERLCGSPPVIDLVHLGLGADGHTASLVPEDPILELTGSWVGTTGVYQGHRRMSLTIPVLDNARALLIVVTGADKAKALLRLSRHDRTIPAGRIDNPDIVVLADRAAASSLDDSGQAGGAASTSTSKFDPSQRPTSGQ